MSTRSNRHARRRAAPKPVSFWRRSSTLIYGTLGALAVVVVAFVLIAHARSGSGVATGPASKQVVQAVANPPPSVLQSVGTAGYRNPFTPTGNPKVLKGPSGRPEVLYVGAEYCPYCAAERWSIMMALGRFGTFSNLHYSASSSTDAFPDTPTFTFHGSTYSSQYVDFVPVETETRDEGQTLETPTEQEQLILQQYNTEQYTGSNGSIPFLDVANQYVLSGAGFQPDLLAGLTHDQIASKLSDPNSPVTKAIVANANYITAAICRVTGNQPSSVCGTAPIPSVEQQLQSP